MALERDTQVVAHTVGRLAQQYKDMPDVLSLVAAIAAQVQELEDQLFTIPQARALATASGDALDQLGALIGLERNGLEDDAYRLLLRGQVAVNFGTATTDNLVGILTDLFEAAAVYVRSPMSPIPSEGATLSFGVGSPQLPETLRPLVLGIIRASIAAGVSLSSVVVFNAQRAFAFAGKQPWVAGFGSVNDPTAGGGFSGHLFNNPV